MYKFRDVLIHSLTIIILVLLVSHYITQYPMSYHIW